MGGKNLVEKVLQSHLVQNSRDELAIAVDQTLTQDATGTMAYMQFESLPLNCVRTSSFSYIDHNTIQQGFENADDHAYLRSVAAKYGITFSKAGNGICHQVHLERFAKPGATLLGSDSHTPTAGGIGSLAIGCGGLDVALAMAGQPFYMPKPRVINVRLKGWLNDFVSAKDIILKLLSILTTKGNVGCIVEYSGDIAQLSVPERATMTNMGAELGVTTSIFPSDKVTREFLEAQGRAQDWKDLRPDMHADYDRVIEIDLGNLEPMAAHPHSPDNVFRVRDSDVHVDQVCIGSCTNSSYKDLMIAARMLHDGKASNGVSFIVTPGSRQVLEMIAANGALAALIEAGARVTEPHCGFCIGACDAPGTNQVSVRTNNRNFKGRSGTPSAGIYLASVETAVASAISGRLTDPRDIGIVCPSVEVPASFWNDDSMFESRHAPDTKIIRGPNISDPFLNRALGDELAGEALIKAGDKVTTDHIMPAGARLKFRSNIPKYSRFVFEDLDSAFPEKALANKKRGIDNVIIAGESYGQGSSREHAAICPAYLGVRAVIAKSIERIHRANLINFGILPLIFCDPKDYKSISEGDTLKISGLKEALASGRDMTAFNSSTSGRIRLGHDLSARETEILLAGGRLNLVKNKMVKEDA